MKIELSFLLTVAGYAILFSVNWLIGAGVGLIILGQILQDE